MDQKIITELKNRLTEALPGWDAQQLMATEVHQKMRLKPKPNTKRAGVLVLFYADHDGLKLPFILRATYKGVHSGQIAFPGGKFEETDSSITETALRETWEEIGVKVTPDQVIGQLSDIYIPPSNLLVTPTVAFLDYKPTYKLDPYEVHDIIDIDADDLLDIENQSTDIITSYEGHQFEVPCYNINGKVIWGATAMMISELNNMLEEVLPEVKESCSK